MELQLLFFASGPRAAGLLVEGDIPEQALWGPFPVPTPAREFYNSHGHQELARPG